MSYDTESRNSLPDDKELIEKLVDEDSHSRSNSRVQTAVSQKRSNIDIDVKCDRDGALTSIDNDENDRLSVVPDVIRKVETEVEDDKDEADKTISIVDKETRNNSNKEEQTLICFGNTDDHILDQVSNPTKGSENLKRSKSKKRAFSLLDILISTSILAPFAIGFWRGVWGCMDRHAELFPGWFCFTFGAALLATYTIFKDQFHNVYMKKWAKSSWRKRLFYRTLRILYTYTFGVACIAHWRGGWIIIDNYLFMHTWITMSLTCSLLACLAILRSVRNLITTPMITQIDTPSCVFQFPTRYNVNTRDWSLYLLDCAFSVGVVGTLVVFVWRGVWFLIDLYLFPENPEYSAVGSLAIGYLIVAVTFCLQPLMRYICARLQGLLRLLVADAFLLLSFLGTVNVWRGIWNALDLWLLPDNLELSCWITHVGCFVLLVLLNCSNTILVRGVYIDAEEEEGQCVVFPCHYLRLFFKIEREKKRARQRKLLVSSQDFVGRIDDVNDKDGENGTLLPNNTTMSIIPANTDSIA